MSNNFNNTNSNEDGQERRSAGSVFENFANGDATATFYITIDTNLLGNLQTQGHVFPIFIIRDVPYDSITIDLDSGTEGTSFVNFVKELINSIRRKERIRKELLKNRPYVFARGMESHECTVCLSDFKPKQHIRKLDCEHEFHKRCIDKWLLKGNACCPICRKEPFSSKGE